MSWIAGFAWGMAVMLAITWVLFFAILATAPGPAQQPRTTLIPPVEYTPRP